MEPFYKSEAIPESLPTVEEIIGKGFSRQEAEESLKDCLTAVIYKNDVYQVVVKNLYSKHFGGEVIHLSVKRIDRQPIHDWRDLQTIKNLLTDPQYEAVELYPAEDRKVDSANQYHLWVFADKNFRIPLGWTQRMVSDDSIGRSVNRALTELEKMPVSTNSWAQQVDDSFERWWKTAHITAKTHSQKDAGHMAFAAAMGVQKEPS